MEAIAGDGSRGKEGEWCRGFEGGGRVGEAAVVYLKGTISCVMADEHM
jgi:hypothetical protein